MMISNMIDINFKLSNYPILLDLRGHNFYNIVMFVIHYYFLSSILNVFFLSMFTSIPYHQVLLSILSYFLCLPIIQKLLPIKFYINNTYPTKCINLVDYKTNLNGYFSKSKVMDSLKFLKQFNPIQLILS